MNPEKRSTLYTVSSNTKCTEINFCEIRNELESLNYDRSSIFKAILILEELVTNILKYSKTPDDINLAVTYSEKQIKVNISDSGKRFNPLEAKKPELNKTIQTIHPGGLGINIVRNLVDSIDYYRVGGDNILTLAIQVKKPSTIKNHNKNLAENQIRIKRKSIPPLAFKTNIHQAVQI